MSIDVETTKLTKIEDMDTDALVRTMKQLQREVSKRQQNRYTEDTKAMDQKITSHIQQWESKRDAATQQREAKRQERDRLEGINSAKRLERESHVRVIESNERQFGRIMHDIHSASCALKFIDEGQKTATTILLHTTPMPGSSNPLLPHEKDMFDAVGHGQVYAMTVHLELEPQHANLQNLSLIGTYLPKAIQWCNNFNQGVGQNIGEL